jgi:hypothetical protein
LDRADNVVCHRARRILGGNSFFADQVSVDITLVRNPLSADQRGGCRENNQSQNRTTERHFPNPCFMPVASAGAIMPEITSWRQKQTSLYLAEEWISAM